MIETVTREFCAENLVRVREAIAAGARYIELCDNLAVGGTTPGYGVIKAAVELAARRRAFIMSMVRPRGGDFVYNDEEAVMMLDDISVARALGVTGVVFGCLERAPSGELELNYPRVVSLVRAAKNTPWAPMDRLAETPHDIPVQVTFHMAFDQMSRDEQLETVPLLARMGVDRILTHGGPVGTPIEENLPWLARLIEAAEGRITILPGGGITFRNAERIARDLGVAYVHGTRIVEIP